MVLPLIPQVQDAPETLLHTIVEVLLLHRVVTQPRAPAVLIIIIHLLEAARQHAAFPVEAAAVHVVILPAVAVVHHVHPVVEAVDLQEEDKVCRYING